MNEDFKVGDFAFIELGWLGCPTDIVKCKIISPLNSTGQYEIVTLERCSLGSTGYKTFVMAKSLLKRTNKMDKVAEKIVSAILDDLTGRKGLRHEWDMIDEDIQEEIKAEWTEIIDDILDLNIEKVEE